MLNAIQNTLFKNATLFIEGPENGFFAFAKSLFCLGYLRESV
ncbi:hypothetical protein VAEKB19_5230011 [Vibrio aestuarianus]|nr:hypothetical protein VAEKB19_5230011 [Vibrio aestuarianus]